MGLTRFTGPVYGARGTLWSFDRETRSSGASTVVFVKTVVPSNEDWFVTDINTSMSTNSSNAQVIYKSKVGGVVTGMLTVSAGASTTGINVTSNVGSLGGSSGSWGYYCPTGSTLYAVSTSVNPIAMLCGILHGWRQWVNVGNLDVLSLQAASAKGGGPNFTASTRSYGN